MLYDFYALIVVLAAIIYSLAARLIQNKLVNKQEMQELQEESKKLNNEYNEAKKSNDKIRQDQVNKKQLELFPKMNKVMMGNLKVTAVVLIVLFAFSWLLNNFDPSLKDDVTIILVDNQDGTFMGTYTLNSQNSGTTWSVHAKAYEDNNVIAENYTLFSFETSDFDKDAYYKGNIGSMSITLDKSFYRNGDTLKVLVKADKAKRITATFDNGTNFYVDLPFTIPLINVKRIHEPYWWFIFVSFVFSLIYSVFLQKHIKWL